MHFVNAVRWLSFVDDIGYQIVTCAGSLILFLGLGSQKISKVNTLDGKVDNSWILLHKESVFGEALHIQNDEGRQSSQFELPDDVILVRLVLLLRFTIKLVEQREQADLWNDIIVMFIPKKRRRWQFASQIQKWRLADFPILFSASQQFRFFRLVRYFRGQDLFAVDSHASTECPIDDT